MTARTYVVGLPVCVTINEDGTVTLDVDTAELFTAPHDDANDPDEHTDEQRQADADYLSATVEHAGVPMTLTLPAYAGQPQAGQ